VGTRTNSPVFCDESGARSVLMQWGGRGAGLLLLLLFAGLALALQTRVDIPGLSRLLPEAGTGSELFHSHVRRAGVDGQVVRPRRVMVPEAGDETVAPTRRLPVGKPNAAAPTIAPVAEPAVTPVQPTVKAPATSSSAGPTPQASPTGEPNLTADPTPAATVSPSAKQRNPNAAVPGENPNARGSAGNAPGQTKAKSKARGKAGNAPSPEAGVEQTTP
jgi:hypothetical protein